MPYSSKSLELENCFGFRHVTDSTDNLIVEARGLTKVFRDFWGRPKARAVNGVDFTVSRGQVFGLLGPNGSGKSTTVKMLLGLLYPTRGKLVVLGESPRHVETKRRIGYLPEESYLYRYLTASETLDFFGALFGIHPEERRKRTDQLLEMVGLSAARNRAVGEFSKGMARRIGLAQALVNDPELVILDEPTSGLDPIGCREVKDVIKMLARRGKTVILCSHLLADVEDVCDEVLVLYGGKVCVSGRLSEMLKIEDRTRITVPRLSGETLERVLRVLREAVAEGQVQVDSPSMNLEEFFLDVVRRARESSMETAGAQAGAGVASYLRQGLAEAPTGAGRAEILQSLAGAPPDAAPAAAPSPAAPAAAHVDVSKLQGLAGGQEPVATPAGSRPAPAKGKADDLNAANERLKQLMSQPGEPKSKQKQE